jgi:hypothetical protein
MAAAQRIPLVLGRTTTGAADAREAPGVGATVHARVVGTGAVGATVDVQVSNFDGNWLTLGSLVLSGTNAAQNGLALEANWAYIRANVTALTGTGATLDVIMGSRDT